MSDIKGVWIVPVVTGALATIIGGALLAWFNVGSNSVSQDKPKIPAFQNELLQSAGSDYSDLTENVKIRFDGIGRSFSQFTGIPDLIFSFTNLSPKTASISGSKGCDFVRWRYSHNGRTVEINKTAMLNQNGSSTISVPAQTTKKISYRVDLLETAAYGSEENVSSVCRFWVGFGNSAMVYEATALVESPVKE